MIKFVMRILVFFFRKQHLTKWPQDGNEIRIDAANPKETYMRSSNRSGSSKCRSSISFIGIVKLLVLITLSIDFSISDRTMLHKVNKGSVDCDASSKQLISLSLIS